jgi:hypothetical protein
MIKKRTITPKAIVFGTDAIATRYALENDLNRQEVVLATHPEALEAIPEDEDIEVDIVRVPEDKWKPNTHPDEARVKDTEKIIKGFTYRGIKGRPVELS